MRVYSLPFNIMQDVIRVLMHGAHKYSPNNWKKVKPKERYFDACIRHLVAWQSKEKLDVESKLPHLAHAICCLIFLLWNDKEIK